MRISGGKVLAAYHSLPIGAKQALAVERWRLPEARCPDCLIAVVADQLAAHRALRCPGQPVIGTVVVSMRKGPCR